MLSNKRRELCVKRFLDGEADKTPRKHGNRHMITDGQTLWLYGEHYVGARKSGLTYDGQEIVYVNSSYYSNTTSSLSGIILSLLRNDSRYRVFSYNETLNYSVIADHLQDSKGDVDRLGLDQACKEFTVLHSIVMPEHKRKIQRDATKFFKVNYTSLLDIQKDHLNVVDIKWEVEKLLTVSDITDFDDEAVSLNVHLAQCYLAHNGKVDIGDRFKNKDILALRLRNTRSGVLALKNLHHKDWWIKSLCQEILEGA